MWPEVVNIKLLIQWGLKSTPHKEILQRKRSETQEKNLVTQTDTWLAERETQMTTKNMTLGKEKSRWIMHTDFRSLPNSNKIRGNRFFFRRRMWDESITGKKKLERQKADGRKVNDLADPRKLNKTKPIVRKTEKQYDLPKKNLPESGKLSAPYDSRNGGKI